jgi:hypothetical protein
MRLRRLEDESAIAVTKFVGMNAISVRLFAQFALSALKKRVPQDVRESTGASYRRAYKVQLLSLSCSGNRVWEERARKACCKAVRSS